MPEDEPKGSEHVTSIFCIIHIPCNGLIIQHLTQHIAKLIISNHLPLSPSYTFELLQGNRQRGIYKSIEVTNSGKDLRL